MLKTIKMAALAATVTVTGLSFSGPSVAQDVEFLIGPNGLQVRRSDYCERNPQDRRRCRDYIERRRGDDGGGYVEGRRRRMCDTDDAVDKARDMGLRRARVVDAGRRTVTGLSFSGPSVAQDVEFLIGPNGLQVRRSDYCERNPQDRRRCRDYIERRRGDDGGGYVEGRRRRMCDTDDAVDKARDMGLRRARVVDAGRRTVEVAGVSRRGRMVITFGRERGCPVLDREYIRSDY